MIISCVKSPLFINIMIIYRLVHRLVMFFSHCALWCKNDGQGICTFCTVCMSDVNIRLAKVCANVEDVSSTHRDTSDYLWMVSPQHDTFFFISYPVSRFKLKLRFTSDQCLCQCIIIFLYIPLSFFPFFIFNSFSKMLLCIFFLYELNFSSSCSMAEVFLQ